LRGADLGESLAEIAEEAARFILPLFRSGLEVSRKLDESPVTIADQQAEVLILQRLAERHPDIPAVSEEHASDNGVPAVAAGRFFLVDPIDGTKAFVRGNDSFTVNIGLIEGDAPVAGAVVAPVTGRSGSPGLTARSAAAWATGAGRRSGCAPGRPSRSRWSVTR
jgi:3'(2'), 5'-bisphosphate nucleotidase